MIQIYLISVLGWHNMESCTNCRLSETHLFFKLWHSISFNCSKVRCHFVILNMWSLILLLGNCKKIKKQKLPRGKKTHGFCETLEILSHFEIWQCSTFEVNFPRCFVLPIWNMHERMKKHPQPRCIMVVTTNCSRHVCSLLHWENHSSINSEASNGNQFR